MALRALRCWGRILQREQELAPDRVRERALEQEPAPERVLELVPEREQALAPEPGLALERERGLAPEPELERATRLVRRPLSAIARVCPDSG